MEPPHLRPPLSRVPAPARRLAACGVCLVLAACGRDVPAHGICARVDALCGLALAPEDTRACADLTAALVEADDLRRLERCVDGATSCSEGAGCIAGAVDTITTRIGDDFERGRQRFDDTRGAPRRPASEAPPGECARAEVVCGPDARLEREACRDMVSDLRADPDNLATLRRCYEAARNCIAFDACTDEMWFSLH